MSRPRFFHAYCVGLSKSGTTSMAGIFRYYRSFHGYQVPEIVAAYDAFRTRRIGEGELRDFVLRRDAAGGLEMDSSGLLYWLRDHLVREFPAARFVFTVRDCFSWCDSMIRELMRTPPGDAAHIRWTKVSPFGLDFDSYRSEAAVLRNAPLVLERVLAYWSQNEEILAACPPERTLVVRTAEISGSLGRIAAFLGIPPETLDAGASLRGEGAGRILDKFDRGLLEDAFNKPASSRLMRERFPEATLEGFLGRKPGGAAAAGPAVPPDPAEFRDDPVYPPRFLLAGARTAADRGETALAARLIARAETLIPDRDELLQIESLHRRLGRVGRSLEALKRLTEDYPEDIELWVRRAEAAVDAGKIDAAREALGRAAVLGPEEPQARLIAALRLRIGDPQAALAMLDRPASAPHADAGFWALRAEAAAASGSREEALRSLERAASLEPGLSELRRMARVLLTLEEPERAFALLADRAVDVESCLLLAEAAFSGGRPVEAEAALRRAGDAEPDPNERRRIDAFLKRLGEEFS